MIRTRAVALAPTGRSFAAATTEGLLVYTLDQGLVFDPTDLAQDVTPEAAHVALAKGQALRAALIALRLRDGGLLRHALLSTQPEQVGFGLLASCVPARLYVEWACWGPVLLISVCVTGGLPSPRGCRCGQGSSRCTCGVGSCWATCCYPSRHSSWRSFRSLAGSCA